MAISNGGIARASTRRAGLLAIGLVALFVMGIVREYPWLLVAFAVLGIAAGFGFWTLKSAQQREQQLRREQFERDMIAGRADYEDQLYVDGDPRGFYGRHRPADL